MKTGVKGEELIKSFENLELTAYLCPAGKWTIGWGHTRNVKRDQVITAEKAEAFFRDDIFPIEEGLNRLGLDLNQNQFDALVSFVFNVGWENFSESTLLRRIQADTNHRDIPVQFARWNKITDKKTGRKKVSNGLVRRRKAEADLYMTPVKE